MLRALCHVYDRANRKEPITWRVGVQSLEQLHDAQWGRRSEGGWGIMPLLKGSSTPRGQLHPFWQRYVYIIEGNGAFSK